MSLRLRAGWVVPAAGEPIRDGEIVVEDQRIVEVRPAPVKGEPVSDARDFGDAVLMPGLVNVHSHIDYTVMRGLLEDLPFFDWIRELTARKAALTEADWIASATMGAAEAVAGGVTAIGDCTDSGAALLGAKALGLRGIVYQEAFSVPDTPSVEDVVADLKMRIAALRWSASGTRLKIGISPHAPYTVQPSAFRALAEYARAEKLPVCIHAAESLAEAQLIRDGRGTIADRFAERGITWHLPHSGMTSVNYLDSLGALGPHVMLVHGVQIAADDREIIRRHGLSWAHCPKSNAKLGNGVAPLGLLRECYPEGGMRVGLGSDSVASNNTMDLFEEMRFTVLAQRTRSRRYDAMTAREALHLATIGGARALGMENEVGSLEPGKQADIIAVRTDGLATAPCHDPYSALVYAASARDVRMTMIAGSVVNEHGRFFTTHLGPARHRFNKAAAKIRAWSLAS